MKRYEERTKACQQDNTEEKETGYVRKKITLRCEQVEECFAERRTA